MKKITVLFLALIMAISTAACGAKTDAPAASSQPSPAATEAPATEPPVEKLSNEEIMGALDGQTYTNSAFDLTCTLGEGWTYASDEEMLQISGLTAEMIQDESISDMLEESSAIYTMYALNQQTGSTINMGVQKLNLVQGLVSEEAYVDASAEQTVQALESMGMTIDISEHTTVSLAGADRECLHIEGSYSGVPFFEDAVFVKSGGYLAVISFACYQADTLADMEALFSAAA